MEVASSSLVGRSNRSGNSLLNMVTWPSGKARVCKTLIHQFKSGRHLQKIPGSFGFRDFFVLHCPLPASSPSQSPAVTDSPFCRYATSSPGRGKSFLKGRASGETGHFAVKQKSLPQHPLSHGLHRASSPKGTPLSYTGNFAATTEAVPLGKVAKPQALTEGVSQKRTPPVAYGDSPL